MLLMRLWCILLLQINLTKLTEWGIDEFRLALLYQCQQVEPNTFLQVMLRQIKQREKISTLIPFSKRPDRSRCILSPPISVSRGLVVASPFLGWLSSLGVLVYFLIFPQVIITDRLRPRQRQMYHVCKLVSCMLQRSTCIGPCDAHYALLVVPMVGAHGPRCFSLGHFDLLRVGASWDTMQTTAAFRSI
jgi:hypothetical protein